MTINKVELAKQLFSEATANEIIKWLPKCENCLNETELNALNLCADCSHRYCDSCGDSYEITADVWNKRVMVAGFATQLTHPNCEVK